MNWTQDDLAAIKAAMVELGKGKRAVNVQFADGKRVTYGETSLPDLILLRKTIEADLAAERSPPVKAFRLTPRSGY